MTEAPLRTLSEQADPKVAALLVVDMQNDFCHPQGVSGKRGRQQTMTIEMAPRLEAFIKACRGVGMPVIFVKTIHYPWTDSPSWVRRLDRDGGDSVCRPGTWGAEFYARIQPEEGEIIITTPLQRVLGNQLGSRFAQPRYSLVTDLRCRYKRLCRIDPEGRLHARLLHRSS